MSEFQNLLVKLYANLNMLKEREAKYGINPPPGLPFLRHLFQPFLS